MNRNGQIQVVSQFFKSGKPRGEETSDDCMIYVDKFETAPATVEAEVGMTVNLGNYESLRITAGVRLPCYKEEIEPAYKLAFDLAQAKMLEVVQSVKSQLP